MKTFTKAYLNLISEMNEDTVENITQNLQFNQEIYDKLCQKHHFLENPAKYSSYKYSGYTNIQEEIQEVELSNGKYVTVYIEDQEVFYTVDPGQNGGWTDPSWDPYLEECYVENEQFYKDLNNVKNNNLIQITDQDNNQIEFTSLSLYDRFLIVKAILEYEDSEKWQDDYSQKIWEQINQQDEPDYDDRWDDNY